MRSIGKRWGAVALAAALLLAAATPASARKTHLFLETFGSAAQPSFQAATGLAVDQASGDLLVIDSQADTLTRWNPDGTPDNFAALGTNAIDAEGGGQCPTVPADCDQTPENGFTFGGNAGEEQVAVDNSGTTTDGNIYLTQGLQSAGNLIDIFAAGGEYLGQLTAAGETEFGTTGSFPFSPCGVAVDASGNLFVAAGYENKIYKFDPAANPPVNGDHVATFSVSEKVCNLAAGAGPSDGALFANTFFTFNEESVLKLDAISGALRYVVDPGEDRLISVDPASGHLYAFGGELDQNNNLANARAKELDAAGASGASLLSEFSPGDIKGIAVEGASGRVYVAGGFGAPVRVFGPLVSIPDVLTGAAEITGETSARVKGTVNPDGEAIEECFFEYGTTTAYGQIAACAQSPAEIGAGASPVPVHADLSGLGAETLYHYRLLAKNPNATVNGLDRTFKTPSKPAIKALWAADVGETEAKIKATINPENSPTTYRFEWGKTAAYGNSTTEIALGSDDVDRTVSLPLGELEPATTYHYRVLASNGIGVTGGADHAFTTFPPPPDPKTSCPNQEFRSGASAYLPDCRAYEMVSPVDKGGADIAVLFSALNFPAGFEMSAADGDRLAYSSQTAFGDAVSAPYTSQYLATRKPGQEWSTHAISPPRGGPSLAPLGVLKFDVQFKAFAADLGSGWLLHDTDPPLEGCAVAGYPNLYRRDNGTGGYEALIPTKPPYLIGPELQGVSEDGSHAVFTANAKLTPNAAAGAHNQLYEHVSGAGCGELRLVSVLPSGKASTLPSTAGTTAAAAEGEGRESTVARAVSADGARIYWSTVGSGLVGPLYLRIEGKETVQVSSQPARFWTAATDGSKAIYTVGEDLYEFELASKALSPIASSLIAGESAGVVEASEDLSRIYFISEKALTGDAEVGEPNLYLREAGSPPRLVKTLAAADLTGDFRHADLSILAPEPIKRGTRITPDGRHLAFPSTAPLTGYDNKDASEGRAAIELFLYDAASGELRCVSCNPSGARPRARLFEGSNDAVRRVAAKLPAWQNQLYAPRALSADGSRLFFESFDALVPRDTNGRQDVYEWSRASGAQECEAVGADLYVQSSGGCLSLISSGRSPSDSQLVDASADGRDVFLKTASSLLPSDPGLIDIYDARALGGLPPPEEHNPECEGEACQSPPAPPQALTPGSFSFSGPGSRKARGSKARRCAKGKRRAVRHGKPRCVRKRTRRRGRAEQRRREGRQ